MFGLPRVEEDRALALGLMWGWGRDRGGGGGETEAGLARLRSELLALCDFEGVSRRESLTNQRLKLIFVELCKWLFYNNRIPTFVLEYQCYVYMYSWIVFKLY